MLEIKKKRKKERITECGIQQIPKSPQVCWGFDLMTHKTEIMFQRRWQHYTLSHTYHPNETARLDWNDGTNTAKNKTSVSYLCLLLCLFGWCFLWFWLFIGINSHSRCRVVTWNISRNRGIDMWLHFTTFTSHISSILSLEHCTISVLVFFMFLLNGKST